MRAGAAVPAARGSGPRRDLPQPPGWCEGERRELLLDDVSFGTTRARPDPEDDLHLLLDLGHHRRVVLEEHLRVLAALADLLAVVAVPGTRLLDDVRFGTDVD